MSGSTVDSQSPTAENTGEEKNEERRKKETTTAKHNGLPYWATTNNRRLSQKERISNAHRTCQ